jgi:rfaE bifunctional protein kinase chain/domain
VWDNAPVPATAKTSAPLTLHALVDRFSRRKVVVVGDLVADHYIFGQTDRISREAPVLIVRFEHSEVRLGGGGNAAANAKALGGQVTVVGALGKDEMGRALRGAFKEAGIKVLAAQVDQTETKTRILAGGINTSRQQMLRLDRGAGGLPDKAEAELARQLGQALKDAEAVLVSDYGAGALSERMREVLAKHAKRGLPVCVDSRFNLAAYRGFTVCKPNEPELEALTGVTLRTEGDLLGAGRIALKRLGCQSLVVTRGRNGMAIFDAGGGAELLPAYGEKPAVDVTGAGDTVISALTLGLAAGGSVAQAARLANIAGSLSVAKLGAAQITQAEILEALPRR